MLDKAGAWTAGGVDEAEDVAVHAARKVGELTT
jgi:hypothetical protein